MNNSDLPLNFLKFKITTILNIFFTLCFLILGFHYLFSAPIGTFINESVIIHIAPNDNLNSVADTLEKRKIIRHSWALKVFVFLFNTDRQIDRGDYLFSKKSPVSSVAWQLAKGKHKVSPIKVTLREGLTNKEMADILANKLTGFRRDLFLSGVNNKQGYLFPDTYFFFSMDTAEEIIDQLSENFKNQIKKIQNLKQESKRDLSEIIIMASIIEKEANGEEDASIISGILWKRIRLGIPLQVDAEKSTYKIKGLPDNPICNPGIISIKAALQPTSSPYFYYLHNKNGIVHFANNFEEHKQNINHYLKYNYEKK